MCIKVVWIISLLLSLQSEGLLWLFSLALGSLPSTKISIHEKEGGEPGTFDHMLDVIGMWLAISGWLRLHTVTTNADDGLQREPGTMIWAYQRPLC